MPQTTILAAGQTAAASTDVTIASGGSATFSIIAGGTGKIPGNFSLPIVFDTGANERVVASLSNLNPIVPIGAPGVYRVNRENITAYATDISVLVDQ